jgi:hypothetical protein
MFTLARRGGLLLSASLAASLMGAAPVGAVSGWSGPTRVFSGHNGQDAMAMDVDAQDHTRIIGADEGVIFERTDASGTWRTTIISDEPVNHGVAITFAAHHAYVTHIVDDQLRLLTDATGTWVEEVVPTLHVARETAIAVRSGKIHIAYSGLAMHLHHVSNASRSWVETTVDGEFGFRPSIAIDSAGQAHIAYASGDPTPFRLATEHGPAAAPSFTHRNFGQTGPYEYRGQAIVIDGHDRVHLAWANAHICPGAGECHFGGPDTGTWYSRWTGARWTAPVRASQALRIFGIVLDHHARAVIVTDRVRVLRERSDGTFSSTFLYEPVSVLHEAQAAAIDLGPGDHARVAIGDFVQVASNHDWVARIS